MTKLEEHKVFVEAYNMEMVPYQIAKKIIEEYNQGFAENVERLEEVIKQVDVIYEDIEKTLKKE